MIFTNFDLDSDFATCAMEEKAQSNTMKEIIIPLQDYAHADARKSRPWKEKLNAIRISNP